jgi:hypothetical protein
MTRFGFPLAVAAALAAHGLVSAAAPASPRDTVTDKPPRISLKVNPTIAFSPARVVATADVKGGPNDFQEFYCASVEWIWGDDTTSDASDDCDPYVAGKSEIKRHFVASHVYSNTSEQAREYHIEFRLKQKDKAVGAANTSVRVQPGAAR